MTEFQHALKEIIERSFHGNGSEISRASGIERSVISKLIAGNPAPTITRIEQLAGALNPPDRKQLLLSAARDLIPSQFKEEIFGEDQDLASQILRGKLPPDVARVIEYLERDALKDEGTVAFLRRIGRMAGVPVSGDATPAIYPAASDPLKKVAEDLQNYTTGTTAKDSDQEEA